VKIFPREDLESPRKFIISRRGWKARGDGREMSGAGGPIHISYISYLYPISYIHISYISYICILYPISIYPIYRISVSYILYLVSIYPIYRISVSYILYPCIHVYCTYLGTLYMYPRISYTVLNCLALSWIAVHCPKQSCTVLHCPALSQTVLPPLKICWKGGPAYRALWYESDS